MIKKINIQFCRLICLILASAICLTAFGQRKSSGNSKKSKPVVEIAKVDSTEIALTQSQGIPVAPFKDTIFVIHGNIGSFTVEQRAAAIEERVRQLEEHRFFRPDSLRLVEFDNLINIIYSDTRYTGNKVIISIDTLQASINGTTKSDIAHSYRDIIIKAIEKQRSDTSWQNIGFQVFCVLLIIGGEYFLLKFFRFGHRRLRVFVRSQRGRKIKGLSSIMDIQRTEQTIFIVLKLLRFALVLISLYISLLLLFKLFPYTMDLSDQLLGYIASPVKKIISSVINYLPKLFTIIVIAVIFYYLRKFLRSIADKIAEGKINIKGFYSDWAKPTFNIISAILFVFMFIMIFPYLPNSDSDIFKGVSVFMGLIISLGSTSVIGNLIAGLVITYMRPFKIGDRVKMDEYVGNIIEKTALVTRIKTAKNEIITIPNSTVMSSKTTNYTLSAHDYGLILYTTVTIGYDVPWQQVHDLLLKVAYKTEHLSRKQKPFIMQNGLSEFHVEYQLNVYTKEANRMNDIYSDLRKNIQDIFKEAGIELISPHYRVNRNINEPGKQSAE